MHQVAVGREGPNVFGHDRFQLIHGRAQGAHGREHLFFIVHSQLFSGPDSLGLGAFQRLQSAVGFELKRAEPVDQVLLERTVEALSKGFLFTLAVSASVRM